MKRHWRFWVGLVISAVALFLALRGIDLREVGDELAGAEYVYFVPAGAALLAYLLVRSIRWRLMLGSKVSLSDSFWITNIGYLVSNVFPFRLGDPARAVLVGRRNSVSTAAALSTVVVERVLDMLMIVLLLAVTLPFIETVPLELRSAGPIAGAAAAAALALLIVLALRPDWAQGVLQWLSARVPRLNQERWSRTLDDLLEGLEALRSLRQIVTLLAWSVVTWVFVVLYYWAMLWVFLDQPSLVEGSLLTCAIGLSMALPAAPGAIGAFEVAARYALELPFGVPKDAAIVMASVTHASQYAVMCLLGVVGLVQQNTSFGRLRSDIATTTAMTEDGCDG
jgi:uncharacterized protein (TIRG00374 family)